MEGEPEPEIMFMAVSSRVKPLAVGGGQVCAGQHLFGSGQ
jgi:hypothetical protein